MTRSIRLTLALALILAGLFGGAWIAQNLLALMGEQVGYWPMFVLNLLYVPSIIRRILIKALHPGSAIA